MLCHLNFELIAHFIFSCNRPEAEAEGCGGGTDAAENSHGPAALALRLDPARDLQRLHALLVTHAPALDDRLHRHHGNYSTARI